MNQAKKKIIFVVLAISGTLLFPKGKLIYTIVMKFYSVQPKTYSKFLIHDLRTHNWITELIVSVSSAVYAAGVTCQYL